MYTVFALKKFNWLLFQKLAFWKPVRGQDPVLVLRERVKKFSAVLTCNICKPNVQPAFASCYFFLQKICHIKTVCCVSVSK